MLFAALIGLVAALKAAFPEALRTPQEWTSVVYLFGFLLVVSAGALGLRGAVKERLRHAAIWVGVVAVLMVGYAYREEFAGLSQHLQLALGMGNPVVTGDHELVIPQDDQGAFVVVGAVNGQRVRFMVDTGSSETVLNQDDARRLGVEMDKLDYKFEAETANGAGYGAAYRAQRLEVGPIGFDNFAMVVNKAPMSSSLLGLSFLNRLSSFEIRGRKLILKWR